MTNNSCKKENSSHCFSSILQRMVCGQNLQTHPSPCNPIILKNPDEATTFSNLMSKDGPNSSQILVQVQTRAQAQGPSIVARLMGLESMPENTNNYESLFRSKSLNSLYFYPDFNPTRASFHRRARTSASFHEQSHNNLLVKIDENLEHNGCLESKKPQKGSHGNVKRPKKEEPRENVVTLKENERRISRKNVNNKKRYEQRFTNNESSSGSTSSSVSNRLGKYDVGYNNLREKNINNEKRKLSVNKNKEKKVKVNGNNISPNNGTSMRKVYYKEELNVEFQNDATSRSPISVLDHHHCHLFDSPTKENERQVASHSASGEMCVPKSKEKNKSSKKKGQKQKLLYKVEEQVTHNLVDLLAQIYSVVEDHVRDPKWMTKYQLSKAHFTDELCLHFGDEILDFLLLELMYELI